MKDLFVLVADQDMAEVMEALLERHQSLGIRSIAYVVQRHLQRDPGCRGDAARRLRPHLHQYDKAIVMFDKHGCGREDAFREVIQHEVEHDLAINGWRGRAKAVAVDPELETWIWASSNHVARALGWSRGYDDLRTWLISRGFWRAGDVKPSDPKAAMKAVLRETKTPHSPALFGELARRTTWRHCQCPAFADLKRALEEWFPVTQPAG